MLPIVVNPGSAKLQRGLGFLSTHSDSNHRTSLRSPSTMGKSAKRTPRLPKANPKSEQKPKSDPALIILSSDDEADDDLSLNIVEKATLRTRGDETSSNPSSSVTEVKEIGRTGAQVHAGKDCFICKKGGHRAKDCPEKFNLRSQATKICLNCGDYGHEMFSCKSQYSLDDLKEIQCYVCKCFGHLCCANYAGEGSREVSCYRCGQSGHSGLECAKVHAETGSKWTPSSCYMCGEEAHTACKCIFSSKSEKRKGTISGSKKKKKGKRSRLKAKFGDNLGVRSMPHDLGNAHKRNKTQPSSSQPKPTRPHAYNYNHNHNYNHWWGSPMTPAMYIPNDRFQFQFHGGSGYNPDYSSSGFHSNQGMFNGYHHRFSASGSGNSSNGHPYFANQRDPNGYSWRGL